jgi:hypothetical protein
MKHHIGIVGAGPRGFAITLEALWRGYRVTLFDPSPFSSWDGRDLVPDLFMRSPLTFDCTTGSPHLSEYSLETFLLGKKAPLDLSQRDIESYPINPSREQFKAYGEFLFKEVSPHIEWIAERVTRLERNEIATRRGVVGVDRAIYAGGCPPSIMIPPWVNASRVISLRSVLTTPPDGSIAVVGGGQAGAELYAYLLSLGCDALWFTKRVPRCDPYPVPSYRVWGIETALGGFYKTLPISRRGAYLQAVKAWQPSITPRMYREVEGRSLPLSPDLINKCEWVVFCKGLEPDMERSLIAGVRSHPLNYKMPDLAPGFLASNGVHVSGIFASLYDGPRQGSIISAALTAREILD